MGKRRQNHIVSSYVTTFLAAWCSFMVFCLWPGPVCADKVDHEETCRRIAGKLASVSLKDCLADGIVSSGRYSVLGIPLLIKEYPPLELREPQARVLLVGGAHGDEYASISIVFKWMDILNVHHSGIFHWIFVPLLNPDGLLREQSRRTNARGVDLNRNMPSPLWREIGYERWIDVAERNPRYYPGPYPMSEPETEFLVELIRHFKPHAIVSVHSPLNLLDYDGPGIPASTLGSLRLRRLGNFPGTLGNYAGIEHGIPVMTVELSSSGRLPTSGEISSMWRDLVRWLIDNVPIETEPEEIMVEEDRKELERRFFGK